MRTFKMMQWLGVSTLITSLFGSADPVTSQRYFLDQLEGLDYNQRVDMLQSQAETGTALRTRYWALMEITKMHIELGDYEEAEVWVNKAVNMVQDNWQAQVLAEKIEHKLRPRPSVAEPFRNFNKKHGLSVDLNLGLENANNVIQEAIDPAVPTDKDDLGLNLGLDLGKSWSWKLGGYGLRTGYNFFNTSYSQHGELDIISQTADLRISKATTAFGKKFSESHRLAYVNVSNDGNSLLWSGELSLGFYIPVSKFLSDINLSYKDTKYFDPANVGSEGSTTSFSTGLTYNYTHPWLRSANASLSVIDEHPDTATSRYLESSLKCTLKTAVPSWLWFEKSQTRITVKQRQYAEAAAGFAKRDDDQWKLSLKLSRKIVKNQTLDLKFTTLENDSNLAANHYRNNTSSISYTINY